MISERELWKIERELYARVCAVSETGGVSLSEAADFATRNLARILDEYRTLQREHAAALGEARESPAYA